MSPEPPVPTAGGAGTLWTPEWPRATPCCGVHRPHRAVLAGHHGQHPRPATARGEDSQHGRKQQSWAQYMDTNPESPESFLGYTLAGFAAWVSDQELVSIRRCTKAGLDKAKADGKKLGAPRRLSEEQEAAAIEMLASGVSQRGKPAARCQVLRRIACDSQARRRA